RHTINQGTPLERDIGFSRAVRIGNVIAVSGTAAIALDGSTIGIGDVYVQTLTCLERGIAAIEELGGSKHDVLRTRIMLTDASRWADAARAHGVCFADVQPACTFVEVKGFIRPEWLVETEIDAVCS
ncbi:MAG: Rid family hydrolase, partial [Pseudomonadota bacterium]